MDRSHGTERALAELLERLARQYHCEIHLFSQAVQGVLVNDSATAGSAERTGIVWHRVPACPGPHVVQFLFWLFMNAFVRALHNFRTRPFDLLLSPGINAFHADVIIVHALFHRLQELSQEDRQDVRVKPGFLRDLHRRLYYALLTVLERSAYSDRTVSLGAVSKRTATLLARYFGRSDVRVIPNGVDATEFSPSKRMERRQSARALRNLQDSDCALLLIGNDWQSKGLPVILEAMAGCRDVPLHLLILGNDDSTPFRERARSLGIYERCRWEKPPDHVIDLYAAADIYVSPSREDAFALPPLEAMSCGLPVITSIHNGGSQIITQGVDGFVLGDVDDSDALSDLLQRLAQQPDLRRRVGENAARTAHEYTWDRNAAAVWDFIQDVYARKNRSSEAHAISRDAAPK